MVHQLHFVTHANFSLSHHAKVCAETPTPHEPLYHLLVAETDPELVAGEPRLNRFEHRGADREPIADGDRLLIEPVDGEILAEHSWREHSSEFPIPPFIVRH